LPYFGYFLGFFSEGVDDADVTVVNSNFLLRRSRVPFRPLTDLNLFDKDVQQFTAEFVYLGIPPCLINKSGDV
jgi:hypothetical protein